MAQGTFPPFEADYAHQGHHHILDYEDIVHDHDQDYAALGHSHPDEDTGWIVITDFLNGATAYSTTPSHVWVPRYRRLNGIVYLQGLINTNSTGTITVTNLPVGFRPQGTYMDVTRCQAGFKRMDVQDGGNIVFREGDATTSWHSITATFPADN